MTRTLSLILAVSIALCGIACAQNEKPAGIVSERNMEFSNPSQTIRVTPGETFSIILESNATTGYTWRKEKQAAGRVVTLTDTNYIAPRTNLPGAGGKQRLTFKAESPGTEKLTFHYLRPWEKDAEPARTVRFTVVVE